jgi:hypothetical protein
MSAANSVNCAVRPAWDCAPYVRLWARNWKPAAIIFTDCHFGADAEANRHTISNSRRRQPDFILRLPSLITKLSVSTTPVMPPPTLSVNLHNRS